MLESLISISNKIQYMTTFLDGTVVYFCLLTLNEWDTLDRLKTTFNMSDNVFFEEVFNLCVPKQFKNIEGRVRAGIPSSIGKFIWEQSKTYEYLEDELDIARARFENQDIYKQMQIIIINAYPSYKFEDLDKYLRKDLIDLFVKAEKYLEIKTEGKYKPINLKKLKRQQERSNKIDFARDNFEMSQQGFSKNGEDNPWARNGTAYNVMNIREQAARKAEARKARLSE